MRLPVPHIGDFHDEQKDRPALGTGYFSKKLVLRGLQDRNTTRGAVRIACSLVASSHGLR
jgi:hypothetical protein